MKNIRQVVFIVIGVILILACIALIATNKKNKGEIITETFDYQTEGINRIRMEVGACQVKLVESTDAMFHITTNGFEKGDVSVSVANGELKIKRDKKSSWNFSFLGIHFGDSHDDEKMEVSIPKDIVFEEGSFEFGAASVQVDTIHAKKLVLTIGAGELKANAIYADDQAKITVGAGSCQVDDGKITNAEMDCGVGELKFTGIVSGKSSVDCGVGSVVLRLRELKEADYYGNLDCGLGQIRFGENTIKGSGERDFGFSSLEHKMDVDCGVGEVDIRFE